MVNTENIDEAKELIRKSRNPIIIEAKSSDFNRKILDYGKFNIISGLEYTKEKSSLKNINSGLNEILAKIAKKNDISIGIDLGKIKNLEKKEKAEVLTKIKQNIIICRKTKTKIKVLNYNNKMSASSLLFSLGASSQQVKEAVSF